ncbi:MAG: hypothetical protein QFB89_01330 [Pseudomonadota bacterium]|nr:hypothetical protein [Pseudomonadota bacterium]
MKDLELMGPTYSGIISEGRRKRLLLVPAAALISCLGFSNVARAVTLISSAEAALPNQPPLEMSVRGLDAMSGFVQVLPPKRAVARAPFHMVIRFQEPCHPSSVVMSLVKQPAVDLTARIRPYLTPQGIDVPDAQAPPGNYKIRLIYRDAAGRERVGNILFSIER